MRHTIITAALLIAANTAFANTDMTEPNLLDMPSGAPVAAVSVVDTTGGVYKILDTNIISRTNPNQLLCWSVANLPIRSEYTVREQIESPAKAQFIHPEAHTYTINNGKTHLITSEIKSSVGDISKCWLFDNNDPLGNYSMGISVENWEFTGLNFQVAP